ncbi:MAG: DUF3169 family protein [Lachnospiraceae bacterium]|nr:DUF3169 family protein [Lachnospiraceae bacterium]
MDETRKNEIREENRRARNKFLKIFVPAVIVTLLIVPPVVWFGMGNRGTVDSDSFIQLARAVSPWFSVVPTLITLVVCESLLRRSRHAYAAWNGEEEETMMHIERYLNVALWLGTVNMILGFFSISVNNWLTIEAISGEAEAHFLLRAILGPVGMMCAVAYNYFLAHRIVEFEKEMNPEKKGSVLDPRFNDAWLASCDEAEKQAAYRAAYRSYRTTSNVCPVMWLLCVIGSIFWDIGLFPYVVVIVIWLFHVSSYCLETFRHSQGNQILL